VHEGVVHVLLTNLVTLARLHYSDVLNDNLDSILAVILQLMFPLRWTATVQELLRMCCRKLLVLPVSYGTEITSVLAYRRHTTVELKVCSITTFLTSRATWRLRLLTIGRSVTQ